MRRSNEANDPAKTMAVGGLRLREHAAAGRASLELWPSRMLALPVALFTFLWLRFLWRWYALILLATLYEARGFLIVFGLPFLVAGLSLIATSARLVCGRSVVSLDALRFTVGETLGALQRRALLVRPTVSVIEFAAECSIDGDDGQASDVWQVRARLEDGTRIALPLPVRTLSEADAVAQRLNRALERVRAPAGYRDAVG